jgi:hypothetical protein
MTCGSSRGKLPEVAPQIYKTAPRPHYLGFVHQVFHQSNNTNYNQSPSTNHQTTSCLLPPAPRPLSMASVVAPPVVFSTTSSHRSVAPTTLPTLPVAKALRTKAHPRACSARCGTSKHSFQHLHINSILTYHSAPSEVPVPMPSKPTTLFPQQPISYSAFTTARLSDE